MADWDKRSRAVKFVSSFVGVYLALHGMQAAVRGVGAFSTASSQILTQAQSPLREEAALVAQGVERGELQMDITDTLTHSTAAAFAPVDFYLWLRTHGFSDEVAAPVAREALYLLGMANEISRDFLLGNTPYDINQDLWNNWQGFAVFEEIRTALRDSAGLTREEWLPHIQHGISQKLRDGMLIVDPTHPDVPQYHDPLIDVYRAAGMGGVLLVAYAVAAALNEAKVKLTAGRREEISIEEAVERGLQKRIGFIEKRAIRLVDGLLEGTLQDIPGEIAQDVMKAVRGSVPALVRPFQREKGEAMRENEDFPRGRG